MYLTNKPIPYLQLNLWRYISEIGIHTNQPFEEVRRIRLSNQLAFLSSIITLLYFIIDLIFFERRQDDIVRYTFYVHHIVLSLIVFPILWLNSIGKSGAARIILILAVSSLNFLSGIIHGQPYRTEFYLLSIASALFVLFDKTKVIIPLFTLIVILFILSVYNIQTNYPDVFEFNVGVVIRILISFTFLFAILFLLLSEGKKHQKTTEMKAHLLETERNEVLRANFTKDRVLSVIGHDLRGPINSLKGLLTMISNNQLSQEEFQVHTKNLTKQVNQLQLSLEELLSWSRSQSTSLNPQPEEINTYKLVEVVLQGLRPFIEEKGIHIITEMQNTVLYADAGMIKSVFTNLLTNAIKFTPDNGKISIYAQTTDNTTTIKISDTGVGIDDEDLSKIFEGNYSTRGTNNEKGTGIGLSLCKDFIDRNNGSISVSSVVGEGTTFTFMLPKEK